MSSAILRSLAREGRSVVAGLPRFTDKCHSLIKKAPHPDIYDELKDRMKSRVHGDLYAGLQDLAIVGGTTLLPLLKKALAGTIDPKGEYVLSTRIRVGRNIRGLGLSPGCTRAQRREVERLVTGAVSQLEGDLAGKYYPLDGMSEADRKQLVADHFLFKKGDRFLESAGANRDWPESRGIFHNNEKTFLVWVNEEDQMRIISMQKGGDAKQVFERLARGIDAIEKQVKAAGREFAHNDHLGYIHSCPTNCGTGMRASVHVKIPNVGKHPDFKQWCEKLRLQPRGIHGEHSESTGGIYDISNKERLGKSEVALVQTMIDGVNVLIEAEKALAAGKALPKELQ
ncbi:arginine kinase [Salpingoeca rosetta]|uniref:Arginine kinase n=1 Tax=Salpingoeca rosetta (strain ATCC 50818 / BSB-021) TaxID=946362 RepID=F2UEV8_SALR5|nr:arginine kinase [Salpingoeca rosetta]EGD75158.1 arginine kinase [Salpingoeca rosetta]|eukprot:XP_004992211.1 arginine kinase [Salpingoeca rosetta]